MMHQIKQMTTTWMPEVLLIGGGLLLRLWFALLPLETLLTLLEDDAWMVAAIARHWALGHGITADGVNPTNGFQPLYPLTLGTLPYLLAPDNLAFGFRANLLLCALLNTLALLPLYGLLRGFAARPIALAGLAIVALNPLLVRVSVNAMETSLAFLLLLLFWWYALVRPPATLNDAAVLGVLAALVGLARLDTLIAVALVGVWLLWRELRQRRVPLLSLTTLLFAAPLLVPYFVRNLVGFGSLMPSSGRAVAYMHSYRESFAFSSGLQLVAYQPAFDLTWAPAWLLLPGMLVLVWLFWLLPPAQRWRIAPLPLYVLALTFYYSYLQQQGRPRYYIGAAAVVVLLLCAALHTLAERMPQVRRAVPVWVAGAVAVVAVLLNTTLFAFHMTHAAQAPYQAQPAMYQAALWIRAHLPHDAVLAAQNSGIFQYYSGHVVINADGKLNHEIIPALETRTLDVYLRYKGVTHIVDLEGVGRYVEFYSSAMSEAPTHPERSALETLQVYARLAAAKLGIGAPVHLDERVPTRITQPFESMTAEVQTFPLPNDPQQAVVIYWLEEHFGLR